jgi:neutral ceramidase
MLYQGNAFWRLVRNFLKTPGKEQVDCQHPKPILLDTGEMKKPYDWAVSCFLFCTSSTSRMGLFSKVSNQVDAVFAPKFHHKKLKISNLIAGSGKLLIQF